MADFYLVNDPDLVEVVLTDTDRFQKSTQSQEDLGDLLGQGLVLSEGDLRERQRERIQPAFYIAKPESPGLTAVHPRAPVSASSAMIDGSPICAT